MSAPRPWSTIRQAVHTTLLLSRWWDLLPGWWDFNLCSPFWRLYHLDGPGAAIRWRQGPWWDLPAGQPVLVPAWLRFQTRNLRRRRQEVLHFRLEGLPTALHHRCFPEPLVLADPAVAALLVPWRQGLALQPPEARPGPASASSPLDLPAQGWAAALAQAAAAAAFAGLAPERQAALVDWYQGVEAVAPALARLEGPLDDPPSNAELAALCGIGINHLIRRFRAAVGQTPAQYGLERRIAAAAQALAATEEPLEDIAHATGFGDRFHLSRVFRARLGQPPATYRRQHRAPAALPA